MTMTFDEAMEARRDAVQTLNASDRLVRELVQAMRHRLQAANIPSYVLADLKKELRGFNAHTGRWKS